MYVELVATFFPGLTMSSSALQQALHTHSTGSPLNRGAFSGKGQTLGGRSFSQSSMATLPSMKSELSLLLGLVGAYFIFWYLS
jgi:thioredoxin 1